MGFNSAFKALSYIIVSQSTVQKKIPNAFCCVKHSDNDDDDAPEFSIK